MTNTKYSEKIIDELKREISADNTDGIDTSLTRLAAVLTAEYGVVLTGEAFRKALDKVYLGVPEDVINQIERRSLVR